jgi:hypothetical protein
MDRKSNASDGDEILRSAAPAPRPPAGFLEQLVTCADVGPGSPPSPKGATAGRTEGYFDERSQAVDDTSSDAVDHLAALLTSSMALNETEVCSRL